MSEPVVEAAEKIAFELNGLTEALHNAVRSEGVPGTLPGSGQEVHLIQVLAELESAVDRSGTAIAGAIQELAAAIRDHG